MDSNQTLIDIVDLRTYDPDNPPAEISSSLLSPERVLASDRGWREDRFQPADFVAPSAQTQVRFSIADSPNNSVTEAAIDSFSAYLLSCSVPIFADGFESGDTSAWSVTSP